MGDETKNEGVFDKNVVFRKILRPAILIGKKKYTNSLTMQETSRK